MVARDPDEEHRASTPLELLFDLCFVVAVSQAASQLHHALIDHHARAGVFGYAMVFFAIWWAWVNFTWFASAYDTDDVAYRLLTFLQIVGVLILAAGVQAAFGHSQFAIITVGYLVMRVALLTQWTRAGLADPTQRPVAYRYVVGILVVQAAWVAHLWTSSTFFNATFVVLVVAELAVPAWAEHAGTLTSWHPEHITERYGEFTLIVLGEVVAAATLAVQAVTSSRGLSAPVVELAAGGALLVFSLWWWYFEHPAGQTLRQSANAAFLWGYAHYFVFGGVAALGAGLQAAAEVLQHPQSHSNVVAGLAVALSVNLYLVVTTGLHRAMISGPLISPLWVALAVAVLVVLGADASSLGLGTAVLAMGAVVAALVTADAVGQRRSPALD